MIQSLLQRRKPMPRATRPMVRRVRLRQESPRRRLERLTYNAEVKAFLAQPQNRYCPVWASGILGTVRKVRTRANHHTLGRARHYRDQSTWLAVSRRGHRFIHENPAIAFEHGWLRKRGKA